MIDQQAVESVMEVVDDELRELGALPYVKTLTEIRNRLDQIINDCIEEY